MEIKCQICDNFEDVIKLHRKIFNEDNKSFFDNIQLKDYYKTFTVSQNDKLIAYCIMSLLQGESEIINIGVDEPFRNKCVAKKLLVYAMETLNADKYFLEVSTQNQYAIQLYKNLGFVEIYRRKKYYGIYDAIIMEKQKI